MGLLVFRPRCDEGHINRDERCDGCPFEPCRFESPCRDRVNGFFAKLRTRRRTHFSKTHLSVIVHDDGKCYLAVFSRRYFAVGISRFCLMYRFRRFDSFGAYVNLLSSVNQADRNRFVHFGALLPVPTFPLSDQTFSMSDLYLKVRRKLDTSVRAASCLCRCGCPPAEHDCREDRTPASVW
jgi:hypothetical protein